MIAKLIHDIEYNFPMGFYGSQHLKEKQKLSYL